MRLFNPDCYAVITTDSEILDFSAVSPTTGRRLDMSFNVFATKESEPNDGECTIYNLSKSSREKISEGGNIKVFAGYDGLYKLVSVGTIEIVNSRKPSTDWATSIQWGDGSKQYLEANFSKSYREGVNVKDILADLTSSLGLAVNSVADQLPEKLNGGLSITGKTKDNLNKLTKDYGLEWSIQDEEVTVVSKGKPVDDSIVEVNQQTGLLEFPQVTQKGIDFITQLNTELRPNKLVNIQSSDFVTIKTKPDDKVASSVNGINIVETVRFSGDNFGGAFSAKCKCKAYNE